MKILVTTYPFNEKIEDHEVIFNTKKSKYNQEEIDNLLLEHQPEIIIAGTEKYDIKQFNLCKNLKMISRVGVGTSSINLQECSNQNIEVAITADAPTNSVAELTIASILYLLKKFNQQDMWYKVMGREIEECKIGIIGYGRIGRRVETLLKLFNPRNIYINDPFIEHSVSLEKIFIESDVITFHTPSLESEIDMKDFNKMKKNVCLVNTARADYINENDLYLWLSRNKNVSAAIDVYKNEPYEKGKLLELDNVLLTPHIGSFTSKARQKMEKESIYNINKFLEKEKL